MGTVKRARPTVRLLLGDCLERVAEIRSGSVDAIVTDPPAGIAFMGKKWDVFPTRGPRAATTFRDGRARPRVAGGHEFRGGRKNRDAFIDFLTPRMAEAYRIAKPGSYALVWALPRTSHWTATAVEDAGWTIRDRVTHLFGTGFPKAKSCLKPGGEDWWLAYKPGGKMSPLQIDACRLSSEGNTTFASRVPGNRSREHYRTGTSESPSIPSDLGRWPANVVLSEDAARDLDAMSGTLKSGKAGPNGHSRNQPERDAGIYGGGKGLFTKPGPAGLLYGDSGGASRFFYCPKASRKDRGAGNTHPTVKSTDLMRWLCRLVTPPGGTIADPFMGSGSTGKAAVLEGFGFLGFERDPHSFKIADTRIRNTSKAEVA